MEFSDEEISILHSLLVDEGERNFHEPGRVDEHDEELTDILLGKVSNEAKRRKLWWAH